MWGFLKTTVFRDSVFFCVSTGWDWGRNRREKRKAFFLFFHAVVCVYNLKSCHRLNGSSKLFNKVKIHWQTD